MSENKKDQGKQIPQQVPIKLPDLSGTNNRIEKGDANNRGWDKATGKIHEIRDGGHPGIPPPPPKKPQK